MTKQLRIHRISKSTTNPEMMKEIRQFIEAIYADRAHTLIFRDSPQALQIYLRIEGRRKHTTWLRR